MNKAYKFRLYPNKEQQLLINKTFGCTRFIYNQLLAEAKESYNLSGKFSYSTPAKYKSQYLWLKEVDSLSLANAQLNLKTAFSNFFRDKTAGFPHFKSKRHDRNSYTTNMVNNNIKLSDKHIQLPKLGLVRIKPHRQIPINHVIKACTISRNPAGKYYISILTVYNETIIPVIINNNKVLGLDMDMHYLYTDNQGITADYPRFYRKALVKLQKAQRRLSLRQKGSSNRAKQQHKVAVLHEKITNQRRDFLHKLSTSLAANYDAVAIEDLNMKAMSQSLHLGKSVTDNSWGIFTAMLNYKLNGRGKQLVKIDKWYPSSKTCSVCGYINHGLQLKDKEWDCPSCGTHHQRNWNAAVNIRQEGIKLLTV